MGEASIVEVSVAKVSPYLSPDRPLLWLCEKDADNARLLPIAIGKFEASAIHMELISETPPRPISYDLLNSMLDDLKVAVRQVVIHSVRKQIYYAKIIVERGHQIYDIDSRPSDAVALALRAGAPIFVSAQLLEQAGLEPLEDEREIERTMARFYEFDPQISQAEERAEAVAEPEIAAIPPRDPPLAEKSEAASETQSGLDELNTKLQQAVLCEEYEEAARLRDEIEQRADKDKKSYG